MGERVAVQQQQRPAAAFDGDDTGARCPDLRAGEAFEHMAETNGPGNNGKPGGSLSSMAIAARAAFGKYVSLAAYGWTCHVKCDDRSPTGRHDAVARDARRQDRRRHLSV